MNAFLLLSVLACASAAASTLYTENPQAQKALWEDFKAKFTRTYSTMKEESHRFNNFIENLKLADHRNVLERRAGGSAIHGVTQFADLSQAEFESQYLTSDPSLKSDSRVYRTASNAPKNTGLVDWTGVYTTAVKNQRQCGSCWAFSATEQIESDAMRTLGVTYTLSPEQLVQCDSTCYGCDGGWTERAYRYVKHAGGIETEAAYPYTSGTGITGSCDSESSGFVLSVDGFTTITGESNMASYMQETGPLSVCLDANNWSTYTSGIMKVCGNSVDHCVQAVGVDVAGGYWKVRNSWGNSWGESGYIQLAYGSNTCDITNDPTYVDVIKV